MTVGNLILMSQPVDGVIYVAQRSPKGSAKFLWSAIEVASVDGDCRVEVEEQANINPRLPHNRLFMSARPQRRAASPTLTGNAC